MSKDKCLATRPLFTTALIAPTVPTTPTASYAVMSARLLEFKLKDLTGFCKREFSLIDFFSKEFGGYSLARYQLAKSGLHLKLTAPTGMLKIKELSRVIAFNSYVLKVLLWNSNLGALYLFTGAKKLNVNMKSICSSVDDTKEEDSLESSYIIGARLYKIVSEFGFGALMLPPLLKPNIAKLTEQDFKILIESAKKLQLHSKLKPRSLLLNMSCNEFMKNPDIALPM